MFTKLALNPQLSRKTVGRIHRYLFDFGLGAHRVFWMGGQAYLETDNAADVTLLCQQFPDMVAMEVEQKSHGAPW